ncbi:MAG: tRNA isopentenyl-2-thiomethyl-A-37 hydroxylase MiaE [Gammaproteobacteria bacterium]|nr:tRNA isopentenyl-2-thiomethyl-A-37 hydroxylase MiaE [Gammaproteobacteria bacterium]
MPTTVTSLDTSLAELKAFLVSSTPQQWVTTALQHQDILLIDHAHCEKKAAATAMQLMFRYPQKSTLLTKMSRLAREELIHFDQVCRLMQERAVTYDHLTASRYAAGLHKMIRTHEPLKLMDTLIIGAFVEARSCERFAALIPFLDEKLAAFYQSLLKSEARHYQDYIKLALTEAKSSSGPGESAFWQRVEAFRHKETELITQPDKQFRFHSGLPVVDNESEA